MLLTTHVIAASTWMGSLAASITVDQTSDPDPPVMRNINELLTTILLIPAALTTVATGMVIALGTPWGLLRYRWIVAKTAIALAILTAAAFLAMNGTQSVEARAAGLGALILAMVLSVAKPWGKVREVKRPPSLIPKQPTRLMPDREAHALDVTPATGTFPPHRHGTASSPD
jgi:lysylphosphatidylglycerol synthetase-like protein (DUF2156 family)